jgi:hypothetical protein
MQVESNAVSNLHILRVAASSNSSLQPTCYGLRPAHAAELKRWTTNQ